MKMTVKGNELTIVIDLSKDLGPSKSGKTNLIATTQGETQVQGAEGKVYANLNVYRKP